ncbi:MAG: hypothetical protein HYX39_13785 [Bacteroidetes bacterium]|nr:hypothetical protein [Bacteroidota bacterium]
MKNLIKFAFMCVLLLNFLACKKTYSCKAKDVNKEYIFKCENCKKNDIDAYKKEIEKKGYTEVSCEK